MSKTLDELIEQEGAAAEAARGTNEDAPLPAHVKVTRGHDRARVLQVRLNDDEVERLTTYANDLGVPVSTALRALALEVLTSKGEGNDNLEAALARLESDMLDVKRLAKSA